LKYKHLPSHGLEIIRPSCDQGVCPVIYCSCKWKDKWLCCHNVQVKTLTRWVSHSSQSELTEVSTYFEHRNCAIFTSYYVDITISITVSQIFPVVATDDACLLSVKNTCPSTIIFRSALSRSSSIQKHHGYQSQISKYSVLPVNMFTKLSGEVILSAFLCIWIQV